MILRRGVSLLGNKYSDLEMLKIYNLSFSGRKINNPTLTFLDLGEKCQFFNNNKNLLASLETVKFSNIFFRFASLALNSKTMVYSYLSLNYYTYNVSMETLYTSLYISIQIYGQPILLMLHNIQPYMCVSIRFA